MCVYDLHMYTHIHTMEYYLAMKKNEILPFVTMWMELEGRYYAKQKKRKITHDFTHVEFEKQQNIVREGKEK